MADLSDITRLKCGSIPGPGVPLYLCCPDRARWQENAEDLPCVSLDLHSMKTDVEGENLPFIYYLFRPHRWQSLKTRGCHSLPAQVSHLSQSMTEKLCNKGAKNKEEATGIFRALCSSLPKSRPTTLHYEPSPSWQDIYSGLSLELCSCTPQTHSHLSSLCQTKVSKHCF